jgi:hypothetical protein
MTGSPPSSRISRRRSNHGPSGAHAHGGRTDFVSVEAARVPLESRPGERLNFCNTGYEMLGRIIEAVSGRSYEEFLAENIFRPLKMTHTGVDSRRRITPGRAAGYQPDGKGGFSNADYTESGTIPAAGGLYSNADDLLRWDEALYSGAMVGPETLALAFKPATLNSGRQVGYACGWMVSTHRGLREVGHGGDISGYNAYIARYPDQRFTVVVLSNMTMRPAGPIPTAGDLAHKIAELLLSDRMAPEQPLPDVQVDSSVLDAYVGRYRLEAPKIILQNAGDLSSFARGNRLVGQLGPATVPLFAESDTTFYSKGSQPRSPSSATVRGRCRNHLVLAGVRDTGGAARVDVNATQPDLDDDQRPHGHIAGASSRRGGPGMRRGRRSSASGPAVPPRRAPRARVPLPRGAA